MKLNLDSRNFRVFGPDETASNRLDALFEVTGRAWMAEVTSDDDEHLSPEGRVLEVLSEHLCEGMLEGYLLTGRHGLFSCYEAFIHIVASMFNQHAKWLKTAKSLSGAGRWRRSPTCSRPTCGARTTTGSVIKTPVLSITWSTRRPMSSGCTCPLTPTRSCRLPITACAAATTSTSSSPASSPPCSTWTWNRRSSTAPRASASGIGPATTGASSPMWSWPAPVTSRPWRPWPRSSILRQELPDLTCAWSTSST